MNDEKTKALKQSLWVLYVYGGEHNNLDIYEV